MKSIKVKTMLLIILICILVAMVMAISSPGMLSVGLSSNQSTQSAVDITIESASVIPVSSLPAGTNEGLMRKSNKSEAMATADQESLYFSDVETVYTSPNKDQWTYQSPSLYVDVRKINVKKPVIRVHFIAEVRVKDTALLFTGYAGKEANSKERLLPEQIASKNKAVFAVASDCSMSKYQTGIIIRNGLQISDKPTADTLALLPDGTFKIYSPKETTSAALISLGVKNTFSYGPALIRDGVITANLAKNKLFSRCARTGVGMVEPGHYIFIVVDGCDRNYSIGATLTEFAEMFSRLKCKQAYNLDGEQWAVMCFMGKRLNGKPGSSSRKVADVLAVGTSELVRGK